MASPGAKSVKRRVIRMSARILQFLVAAGRALRALRDVVLCDGRAHQVEACDMIAQIGAKARRDRFGDFYRRELDRALPQRVADERRYGDGPRRPAVEKALDLPIPDHAIEQAGPAGGLAGLEHRPDQRKDAGRLNEQPRSLVRDALM